MLSAFVYEPIAIIGIGCRFPGKIISPKTFWDFLVAKGDATREVPADRWSIEKFYDQNPERIATIYTKRGAFLDDVTGFDPAFFGISPREAAYVDPQHRLLLETTWEAFEDAGIPPQAWASRKVGVFVGLFTHDYENIHMRSSERGVYGPHSSTGMSTTIAANRVSHAFDFKGPSMVIDTACSSSLVAVHLACRSLHDGEADLAVAGGVNLQLTPEMTMALCQASMLAPDGRCKSFDARANGYARADGAGMVVLKPLSKAQQDGDAIYALIIGSAVNQDGRTKGITVPNGESQQAVMRVALAHAGLEPSQISYIEAHGTGTPVGDPIEAEALNGVLTSGSPERDVCVIGSVKSNFGHTESAAGVAGLIKVALMQRHGRIPANLHFEVPNPNIPWDRLRLRVPTDIEDWSTDGSGRRLAGVNSFGFGGTNAHLVVANAPAMRQSADDRSGSERALLCCLSARSEAALLANARQYESYLRSSPDSDVPLESIAAQLALGREHHSNRLTVAGRNRLDVADLLDAFVTGHRRPGLASGKRNDTKAAGLVFVCSGMGQQWWAMGRGLLQSEPVFAEKITELDRLFARHDKSWSLLNILGADEASSRIDRTQFAQPAIFSLQVALAGLWESWGVRPDMIVGHSVGEVAAACISEALSVEDAVTVCFHRSRLQATLAGRGGMLAVELPAADAFQHIRGLEADVSVAAVNSPNSVTLAGDVRVLDRLAASLEPEGVFARRVNVEVPYHSSVMREISVPLMEGLRSIAPRRTTIPLVSTVTGEQIDGSTLDADYWNRNVCEPVSFAAAMRTLVDLQGSLFVEISAHPVLATSIDGCLAAMGVQGTAIASLRRKQDDPITFLAAVGQLHCQGYPIAFANKYRRLISRVDLPTYPWQRTTFWSETSESRKGRTGLAHDGAEPDHPLLGERLASPQPAWGIELTPSKPAYLQDHRVQDAVVFPGAGFIEMALAAANALNPTDNPIAVKRISIETPLVLAADAQTKLRLSIDADRQLQIHSLSHQEGEPRWTRHVAGSLSELAQMGEMPSLDPTAVRGGLPDVRDRDDIYRGLDALGLHYGPQFRLLEAAWSGQDDALGRIAPTAEIAVEAGRYNLHPALLDAAFQLLAALPGDGTYLPVSVDRMVVYRPGACAIWAYVRRTGQSPTRVVADIDLADDEGRILASVSGLTCRLYEDARPGARLRGTFLYDSVWVEVGRAREHVSVVPSPLMLAPGLRERHNRRNAESHREEYVGRAWPALDTLATAYFIAALTELGCDRQPGRALATDEQCRDLGISPRHVRFVERMLEHLVDSRDLERSGGQWRWRECPSQATATTQWQSAVQAYPACHAELALIQRCGTRLAAFLRGEEEPLSAVFPVGSPIAEHLYSDSPTLLPYNRIVADAVAEIVRQLPEGETLRILEVGAGTGGLTSAILPLLARERTDYVFTDISTSFINQAKDRFRAYPFVRYATLDIEQDPHGQGFAEGFFDLIISSDAVHATADLRTSLGNMRRLLAPGGALALLELTSPPRWCDLVFGLLPGWWAFSDTDLRPRHATLPAAAWLSVLIACGYEAGAEISDEIAGESSLHSVILARKPDDEARPHSDSDPEPQLRLDPLSPIIVLAGATAIADLLAREIRALGYEAAVVGGGVSTGRQPSATIAQAIKEAARSRAAPPVVVDLRHFSDPSSEPEADRLSIAATAACMGLQEVVRVLSEATWQGRPDLWVVTNGTETVGDVKAPALSSAPVRGFTRVVKNEHAELNAYLVDLSPAPQRVEIAALAAEILSRGDEDEIALRGSRKFVNRVVRHRNRQLVSGPATAFGLGNEKPGARDGLTFRGMQATPPGPGQVQLRICAAGINFKDFAKQVGLVDTLVDGLGLEGAGIVTAVGDGVEQWVPGDCVMGLIEGSLANPVNTDARVLVRKPPALSFEDAAGVPIVFMSAYQALKRQARIAAGETVLIHTATGGFGLAALQVARALGAKVFATAGNNEKRSYLRDCGVEYVGDSRSAAFADEILMLTRGNGVDVVLNTLPAEMNAQNVRLLRPGSGRLIDLRNMHYGAKLDYSQLQKGILFSAFDLNVIARADLPYAADLLRDVVSLIEQGALRPVPYRRTTHSRLSETLHSFRKAAHIGKFVVSNSDSTIDVLPGAGSIKLRDSASYLIAGGLSGFGLSTAHWLADMGARHLVLTSRRGATTPDAIQALAELRADGVEVDAVAADVADVEQMRALIARFGSDYPPLRGVVHSAMVLRDGPIKGLDADQMRSVLEPKIDGAWNLHRLTLGQPLDFFVLYSSVTALFGNRDQANYAAANEFLEVLARRRRADGLPALAIGWGVIGGTGYVSREDSVRNVFTRQGVYELEGNQLWAALAHGLNAGASNLSAAHLDWPLLRQFFRAVATSPRFSLVGTDQATGSADDKSAAGRARSDLNAFATPEERHQHLQAVVVCEVAGVLGTDPETLDLERPLVSLGFDSLMAAELIVAIEHATGYGFSRISLLRQDVTAAELIAEIDTVLSGKAPTDAQKPRVDKVGDLIIEDLSDSEVDGLLRELGVGELSDA